MEVWRRYAIVIIGFLENLAFAGCIFGWPALLHVLQQENIYSHVCDDSDSRAISKKASLSEEAIAALNSTSSEEEKNGTYIIAGPDDVVRCKEQDRIFGLIFTLCVCFYGIPSILVGMSLDMLGLRITRMFWSTCLTLGFISLSFTTKDTSWTLWPAMLLIGIGANPVRLSALQYANLFPVSRSTILFVYTSGHSLSTLVFLGFQNFWYWGVPLRVICLSWTVIAACTYVSSFIMPYKKCTLDKPKEENKPTELTALNSKDTENKEVSSPLKENGSPGQEEELPVKPFMKSFLSSSYMIHLYWCFNLYMLRYYIVMFNPWAYSVTDDPKKIGLFNQINGIIIIISPVFSPLGGMLTDFLMKKAKQIKDDRVECLAEQFRSPAFTMFAANFFILAVRTCILFKSETAIYVSLAMNAMARPLVIGTMFSYVRIRFYPEHFNRLNGVSFTFISCISLFQYMVFVFQFSSEDNYYMVAYMMIAFMISTLISPIHLCIKPLMRKYAKEELQYKRSE